MRIFIAGQPKTGNVWVRKIFSVMYDLEDLNESIKKVPETEIQFEQFVRRGAFKENAIMHQHLYPKPELLEAAESIDCHLISMLRNPYDAFVSFYFYINKFAERFTDTPPGILIDKSIDHPDVIAFIKESYCEHLTMSWQWLCSDKSLIIRYEDLLNNSYAIIKAVSEKIYPIPDKSIHDRRITYALNECKAEKMKAKGGWLSDHIRSATTGNWKEHLTEVHLQVFRAHYADLIEKLGYEVV